jgi:uncharacterized membrane protein YedE/YeeE
MPILFALLGGLLFGLGLIVSGMSNPAKILGFLDLAGRWDPSLMLVMAGAIGVAWPAFRLAGARRHSLLGQPLALPPQRAIDARLVLGSLAFGIGWGVAGFCPGPALVDVLVAPAKAGTFVLAMLGGMAIFAWLEKK